MIIRNEQKESERDFEQKETKLTKVSFTPSFPSLSSVKLSFRQSSPEERDAVPENGLYGWQGVVCIRYLAVA